MLNLLWRERVYLWDYFSLQLSKVFRYWVLGMVLGPAISVFAKEHIHGLFPSLQGRQLGLLGVALSALFQCCVPADLVASLFGENQGFGILMTATIGVPLYACCACFTAAVAETEAGMGLAIPLTELPSGFTDVPPGAYYGEAAAWCREQGIVTSNTFSADTPMTWAAVADALYRAAGSPAVTAAAFPDIPAGSPYASAAWTSASGIISGYSDGSFGVDDPVTRQQMAAILYRHMGWNNASFVESGGTQDQFLEAMAEAAKSVDDYMGDHILYISFMNKLSVDCDCDSGPAEPDMHDTGILASTDPVALDQACVDLVCASEDGASLIARIESRNGVHTLERAEKIGPGSREYQLISTD